MGPGPRLIGELFGRVPATTPFRPATCPTAGTEPSLCPGATGHGRSQTLTRSPATAHDLHPAVFGDWFAAEGGLAGLLAAEQIAAAFTAAFIGLFGHRLSYRAFGLAELGWDDALHRLGAFAFFNLEAFTQHLFRDEVHEIPNHGQAGSIIVCRRRPT